MTQYVKRYSNLVEINQLLYFSFQKCVLQRTHYKYMTILMVIIRESCFFLFDFIDSYVKNKVIDINRHR